jgi:flagellar hook-basal body complex protein FliE
MDTNGIEQMLSALRTTAAQAAGKPAADNTPAAGGADFAQILQSSIDKVNQTQQGPIKWRKNLPPAIPARTCTKSLIALQTASVSFQEMVQVRNKLVTAYQDVMNIQV